MAGTDSSFPISSNSRRALNAFRFTDEQDATATLKDGVKPAHGNKENQSSWLNGVVDPMQTSPDKTSTEAPAAAPAPASAVPEKDSKPIKECPQTPGNRIPLADLISNAEDAFDPAPGPEMTPVDHVIWQHVPVSSNPDTSSQTPARRRRKRRHSSSSPSSPSDGNSKKAQKEPLDLQSIQALFKTPQHDLAAELWNNYMDKNMVEGSEQLPPPRLGNLLSSSPQTPASGRTSRDSSGLRRSISCAAEWPTSRAKRRRVNKQEPGSNRGIFARANSNVLDSGKAKSSRINILLEQIEQSLRPAPSAEMAPPNSSPLRQRMDTRRCRSSSPTVDRKHAGDFVAADDCLPPHVPGDDMNVDQKAAFQDSSSEFGDDDLDQEFLDLAEASADPFIAPALAPASDRQEFDSFGSSGWSAVANQQSQSWRPKVPVISEEKATSGEPKHDDSDDFDDDEYGDFPDSLQDVLAACDAKSSSIHTTKPTTKEKPPFKSSGSVTVGAGADVSGEIPQKTSVKPDPESSGDEFDDDDFDLEAIEQTMKQTGENGQAYVCHS